MTHHRFSRRLLRAGASLATIALLISGAALVFSQSDFAAPAHAQGKGQGGPGPGSTGGDGGHDDGHDDGGHDDGGHDSGHDSGGGGHDGGSGGHSDGGGGHDGEDDHEGDDHGGGDHEPVGGKREGRDEAGRGDRSGGLPVWAREGIPEVELGRLNAARSPDRVLDRAFDEAKANFSASTAEFYRKDLDAMVAELSLNWDDVTFIDSPLQNLALLRDALDGRSVLRDVGITTDIRTLQAAFLGTASDKNIPVTTDTALAISAILGLPLSRAEAEALADSAEKIRIAILAGHG